MSTNTLHEAPIMETDYEVSQNDIAAFQRQGHILLREVATQPEIGFYRQAIGSAVERYNTEKRALADRETYGKAFLQITNLWTRDDAVRHFTLAKRFGKVAADLLGVDAVRVYHDQALYKEAGGGPTPWHQDQYYWPLDTPKTITLWMPLVDVDTDMGTMSFASGSHLDGAAAQIAISDESQKAFEHLIESKGYPLAKAGAMKAGDATFHYGWTIHGAPGNGSDHVREVMTIIYFADGARAIEPRRQEQRNDLAGWLPGIEPGELAASDLNPVVFRR